MVFVSHDRYFIDKLATRVFEIEDGHVHVYPGNYEDYLWRKAGGPEALAAQTAAPEPVKQETASEPAPSDVKKRVNPMKLQKLQEQLSRAEQDIAALEAEIAGYETALADFKSAEETMRLSELASARKKDLGKRLEEWEHLSAELEGVA